MWTPFCTPPNLMSSCLQRHDVTSGSWALSEAAHCPGLPFRACSAPRLCWVATFAGVARRLRRTGAAGRERDRVRASAWIIYAEFCPIYEIARRGPSVNHAARCGPTGQAPLPFPPRSSLRSSAFRSAPRGIGPLWRALPEQHRDPAVPLVRFAFLLPVECRWSRAREATERKCTLSWNPESRSPASFR